MTSEHFVKKIENLIWYCQQTQLILSNFEQVVERENDAIRRSEINELEALTLEKTAFGQAVEEKAGKIRQIMEELCAAVNMPHNNDQVLQLDEVSEYLNTWVKQEPENNALNVSLNRLSAAIQALAQVRFKIFPKLEANSYLVKKLLQYHMETCVFWQTVHNESETVYGKSGRSVGTTIKSILTVRT